MKKPNKAKIARLLKVIASAFHHPDEAQRPLDGWLIVDILDRPTRHVWYHYANTERTEYVVGHPKSREWIVSIQQDGREAVFGATGMVAGMIAAEHTQTLLDRLEPDGNA